MLSVVLKIRKQREIIRNIAGSTAIKNLEIRHRNSKRSYSYKRACIRTINYI